MSTVLSPRSTQKGKTWRDHRFAGTGSLAEPYPLVLRRRAREAARSHFRRLGLRVATLVAGDATLLFVLWYITRRACAAFANTAGALPRILRGLTPIAHSGAAAYLGAFFIGLVALGNYRPGDHRRDAHALFAAAALGMGLMFWSTWWATLSFSVLLGYWLSFIAVGLTLLAERLVVDDIVRRVRPMKTAPRALVIGTLEASLAALSSDVLSDKRIVTAVGFLDLSPYPDLSALGGISDLVSVLDCLEVDTVVLAGEMPPETFQSVARIADAACSQVLFLPNPLTDTEFEPKVIWRRGTPMLEMTRPSLRGQELVLKRGIDFLAACVLLATLTPILVFISIGIAITSRGGVLFRQKRVGAGRREFYIYKFRTMVADAEARRGQVASDSIYEDRRLFKIKNDPRVTRFGRFLRRASLDELPQLWNVLRGDMSLVGPRPPLPEEVALYDEHHYSRFHMRPGITGPWQVNGRNRITDFEEVVQLETSYMRQWTIWKDVEILVKTLPAVLRMDGAH